MSTMYNILSVTQDVYDVQGVGVQYGSLVPSHLDGALDNLLG